jgi:hypothetical protein
MEGGRINTEKPHLWRNTINMTGKTRYCQFAGPSVCTVTGPRGKKESSVTSSTPPAPYLHFPGPAREAPWGASDGQVIDRYGLHWLIGFEDDKDC